MKKIYLFLVLVLVGSVGWGQTVFTDDFNRASISPGGTPSMTYTNTLVGTSTAAITSNALRIANGTTNGLSYVTGTTSSFGSPYNSTLNANTGLVTWTFNFRYERTSLPGGVASGSYGTAIVLAGSSSTFTTGTGYAIAYGNSGTPDPIRLVAYSNGVQTSTNIISSGLADLSAATNYVSVRVTYDPATNGWSLYLRDDGVSAWADPSSGVTNQIGSTTVNSTYTSSSLAAFGFVWSHANTVAATNASSFDNFTVSIAPSGGTPDIALSSPDPALPAGNIAQGTNNNPIYQFDLAVTTAPASLTGVTVTTAGTYTASDFSAFKCWYSADNVFNAGSDALLSTITPVTAGDQVFTPFTSQVIGVGTTGYIFITADASCNAVLANTISVNAITTGQITFTSGNKTGSAFAGGLQTITAGTLNNATALGATNGNAQSSVSWTNPTGCYDEIIIVAAPATNAGTPTGDGTAYIADLAYGSGTALGNGFVVYKGTTSQQVVTALINGTTYFFKIFTRLGTTWSSGTETSATPTAPVIATYNWSGGSGAWVTPGNWTPTRTTPATTDILIFDALGSVTITGVPTETVGKISINGSTVILQPTTTNILTVAGGIGTDLDITATGTLRLDGATGLTVNIGTGATAIILGQVVLTNGAQRLTAADASGITFGNGSVCLAGTGFTGNAFGGGGIANSVVFASGSTFTQQAGSNPFVLTQPASLVVFQTGSLFKLQAALTPSVSGRTYANFEYDVANTVSASGANPFTLDNLIISQGTLNIGMNGGVNIKGNISVATGATLNFNPASAGNVIFNGTSAQAVNNNGTLGFGTNANLVINNSNNVTFNTNVSLGTAGALTLTSGRIILGNNNLVVNTSLTGGSATSYIQTNGTGTLTVNNITTPKTLPIGNARYNPLIIDNGSGHNWTARVADGVTADPGFSTNKAVLLTWDITPSVNPPAGPADITFQFDEAATPTGQTGAGFSTAVSVRAWNRSTGVWLPVGSTSAVNTTVPNAATVKINGLSTFSPYALSNIDGALPVRFTNVKACQQGSGIKVDWSNLTESLVANYKVERSADGQFFAALSTVNPPLNNGGKADYSFFDANPVNGVNFYRIQSLEVDGQKLYSVIVRVDIRGGKTDIAIYPNPVSGNTVSFQATALPKGQYSIWVINAGGQAVFTKSLQHTGGAVTEALQLPATITAGIYSLQVSDGTMNTVRKFIIR